MRRTFRLLAAAKPARYLEPYTPTGLTGLHTHPAPRSTLIYLYSSTLEKLKAFPESSVYRQSVEGITKLRLDIITKAVPEGYEEWAARAKKVIAEHPEVFNTPEGQVSHDNEKHIKKTIDGRSFVTTKADKEVDDLLDEWDGEANLGPELEGVRTAAERAEQKILAAERPGTDKKQITWEPEPPLTIQQ
jgi:NADH dehydrogenase (ubiquinone) 1 alpha subcomplex subunit 5